MKTNTAKQTVKSKTVTQQDQDPVVALALAGLPTLEELDRACAGFSNEDHIRAGDAHGAACDSAERAAEALNNAWNTESLVRVKALHALASRHGLLRRMHYVLGGVV